MVPSCIENSASGSASGSQSSPCTQCQPKKNLAENVLRLLSWRQISPDVKRPSRKLWRNSNSSSRSPRESTSAKRELVSWVEAESFKHSIAKYCPLVPAPRSTIAAAFSPDGMTLASTHGDHTVKIICCRTGRCMKVLSGHRRTPWVVRFHPRNSEVLASGSLDYEVRLWNATTAECTGSRDFYRPIASLAFHAQGDLLAVASGHKLYIWQYSREGDASSPNIVLRTRRSLRAVHFHPLAAPLLLTAEVNDLDSPDCPMSFATSREFTQTGLHYSPWTGPQQNTNWLWGNEAEAGIQPESAAPMDISPRPSNATPVDALELPPGAPEAGRTSPNLVGSPWDVAGIVLPEAAATVAAVAATGDPENPRLRVAMVPVARRQDEAAEAGLFPLGLIPNMPPLAQFPVGDPTMLHPLFQEWIQSGLLSEPSRRSRGQNRGGARPQFSFAEASVPAATGAELPCTVKLKLWPYDVNRPCALLDPETCRLTIPHAVLCSEMGTHFSPCGRFLAACVACVLPPEAETSGAGRFNGGVSVQSPTQHPISTQQVIYELRIYSLEEATFGEVLTSKAVRAAHCLTSIQFSPTSEHILLAYGRRHGSLLRSIVLDGATTIPVYTILEIYRISDLKLVRVLPSAEDEVNVACFHPRVGGGLVYGTKEGKLRIIRQDWSISSFQSANPGLEDQLLEGAG